MTEVVKVNLGETGAKYLTSRLNQGGVISKSVLQVLGAADNAYSPLPEGASRGPLLQFEHGGITTQRMTLSWFSSHLAARFPVKSEFCFLVEDTWAKPTDSAIYDQRHKVFLAGSSVYYAFPGTEADESGFRQILKSVTSFEYAGFVASCRLLNGPKVSKLDTRAVAELVRRVRIALVSAFDREGLIISDIAVQESAAGGPFVLT